MAPSSNSISRSTKLQQPISALCFENTSAFRFKTALNDSKSPSPILPLKCSISRKTDLSDSSSYDEGCSGKSEQLNKPSFVSDFLENSLIIDLNSSILFKVLFYQHDLGSLSRFIASSFVSPNSRSSSAKRNQVSFLSGSKPWCPVCSTTHRNTAGFVLLKSSGLKSPSFDYLGWVPDKPVYYHLTNLNFSS